MYTSSISSTALSSEFKALVKSLKLNVITSSLAIHSHRSISIDFPQESCDACIAICEVMRLLTLYGYYTGLKKSVLSTKFI